HEEMLKKSEEEKAELRDRLNTLAERLKYVEFGAMTTEQFHRQLESKLNLVVEKFKTEAMHSDFEWMGNENVQYAIRNFEQMAKVILRDEPQLGYLVERILNAMIGKPDSSDVNKKCSVESKAFEDFKTTMSAEIKLLIEGLYAKQTEELNKNANKLVSSMENVEQKVDEGVVKRMHELYNLVLGIYDRQDTLRVIDQSMDIKIEDLFRLFRTIKGQLDVRNESDRNAEAANISEQKHNLNAVLAYVEQLGGDQLELKARVQNIEQHCAKLTKDMYNNPITPGSSYSIAKELQETGTLQDTPNFTQDLDKESENRDEATNEAEKGK
ncbi:unnamed protein product, partial [Acanthocheilonema viteae]